jgi:beta-1,2-mannobiose phosphorylase / 1,2-beta-oligomannan phosphorylase
MSAKRYDKNPIIKPNKNTCWESHSTFNGCAIKKGFETYILYRAMSCNDFHPINEQKMEMSCIGISKSKDGINFKQRKIFIYPDEEFDKFGCEDPRVTKLGDKYYTFYTALSEYPFRASGIKVAVAISKDLEKIEERHLVTPFNAKAMTMFPEKIDNKIWCMFTYHSDSPPAQICFAIFDKEEDMWSRDFWQKWYNNHDSFVLPLQRRTKDQVEIGAPPIKTKHGWLLFYSYIYDYFSSNKVFSIEAVLLDLKDPRKIIAKTKGPILTTEEYYEKYGMVNDIVFPSGAVVNGNEIYLYYGAADTTCCLAFVDMKCLLEQMLPNKLNSLSFKRYDKNPILSPIKANKWEARSTFNPAAIYLDNKVHILYRAVSSDNISTIGYATTKDGFKIDYRATEPIYKPREEFESSGCEDPRLTQIGDSVYMLYTAYDVRTAPRVALTKISVKDFIANNWSNWSKPILISPPGMSDKDACLFPEKINGKYYIFHRLENEIDLCAIDDLEFKGKNKYLEENNWLKPRKGWWDYRKVGAATPPIKTKEGWILLYHGIAEDHSYSVGAALLDLNDPTIVLARTGEPIFKPETDYEKSGDVPNVVFPCGAIVKDKKIFLYYGGGDLVTGVATLEIDQLLEKLRYCRCRK